MRYINLFIHLEKGKILEPYSDTRGLIASLIKLNSQTDSIPNIGFFLTKFYRIKFEIFI